MADSLVRIGIDLGSEALKVVALDGDGVLVHEDHRLSLGRPRAVLAEALAALDEALAPDAEVVVAATGSGKGLFEEVEGVTTVNEIVATARGVEAWWHAQERPAAPRTVVDMGAQFAKWIHLGPDEGHGAAVVDFATNGLCAAGSGAFLEQQSSRLKLSVEQLGALAASAKSGVSIAGRCSVFAKSDMIHLQQKGTPAESIAFGLCQSLVRTFLSTVVPVSDVATPVALVGGCAVNPGLVRAFREALRLDDDDLLVVPESPARLGAHGAAILATGSSTRLATVRERLDAPRERDHQGGGVRLAHLDEPTVVESLEDQRIRHDTPSGYLGVDVGSVSTNLVLVDADGTVRATVYLPTRGRPVEVLQEGLDLLVERAGGAMTILGVGTTGSGRHLAARLLGGDVVHNEITAQMVSSVHFHPEVDTIFEIGGQDSKYMSVKDGRLVDFEMNKICAAGTGSFLEEQAERLGISIFDDFARLAFEGRAPGDLGSRCTVFMDAELVRAQHRGTAVEDLCAGLAYSVATNYLERVVAHRPVGRHILFQGGTASNQAVLAAFREILGVEVAVHPYNRVSGAIGAALLARRAKAERHYDTAFRGFDACSDPTVTVFECARCENRCQVNRITVGDMVVHFGDICERYTERDIHEGMGSRPFPDLFGARAELMERSMAATTRRARRRPRLGIIRGSYNLELLPLWASLLDELGFDMVQTGRPSSSMVQRHAQSAPAEVCLPVKASVAQAADILDKDPTLRLFVPVVLEHPPAPGDDVSHTCIWAQQIADMLKTSHAHRIVSAQFSLANDTMGLVDPAFALAEALDVPLPRVILALKRAWEVYDEFRASRTELGREALAASFDRAVVVLGKPYNTHDPFLNLGLARHLDRVGLPAIPWDMLPVDDISLGEGSEVVPWHFNRMQLRLLELIRRDERLFPLVVSSFGCGPDAFTAGDVKAAIPDRPFLQLEFDEHQGEAGLVTRLEAFADEIDEHLARGERPLAARRAVPISPTEATRFIVPDIGPHAPIYAAVLRLAGTPVELLPPVDEVTERIGARVTTGRECHPFTLLAGEVARAVEEQGIGRGDVVLFPGGSMPCLIRLYPRMLRHILDEAGAHEVGVMSSEIASIAPVVGTMPMIRLYEGLFAVDILFTLATRLRAYEVAPGTMDSLYRAGVNAVGRAIEERRSVPGALALASEALMGAPRTGDPGSKPVVGVTGDLYTRIDAAGNGNLFQRLEAMGCEVWPSPGFITIEDLGTIFDLQRSARRVRLGRMTGFFLESSLTTTIRVKLKRALSPHVMAMTLDPPPDAIVEMASPYVGRFTNYLVTQVVGKLVEYADRGVDGAMSVAGLNCMVGTAAAAAIPAIRERYDMLPMVSLLYGGGEGPAQQIRLETFVHGVMARRAKRAS